MADKGRFCFAVFSPRKIPIDFDGRICHNRDKRETERKKVVKDPIFARAEFLAENMGRQNV